MERSNLNTMATDKEKYQQLKTILDDIRQDLNDYKNEVGIGMMSDSEWNQLFIERVEASIESYELIEPKE
jgi:hypothetical protein